jgi:hypothetical protein
MKSKLYLMSILSILIVVFLSLFSISSYAAAPTYPVNISNGHINDTDGDGNIELAWNSTLHGFEDGYYIFRSPGNITNVTYVNGSMITNGTQKFIGNVTKVLKTTGYTTFEDNTSVHGNLYYYAILPVNWSNGFQVNYTHLGVTRANMTKSTAALPLGINATSNDAINPSNNTVITTTANANGSIRLTWTAVSDAANNAETNVTFLIFRTTNSKGSRAIYTGNKGTQLVNTTSLAYTDANVTNGVTYYYVFGFQDDAARYNGSDTGRTPWDTLSWPIRSINKTLIHPSYSITYNKTLLVGGYTNYQNGYGKGDGHANTTWIWNGSDDTWYNMTVYGRQPNVTVRHSMAFSSANNLTYLYGGELFPVDDGPENVTWAYNWTNNTWFKINTSKSVGGAGEKETTPFTSGLASAAMDYDNNTKVMILHGGGPGQSGSGAHNNTWMFNVSNSTWTQLVHGVAGSTYAPGNLSSARIVNNPEKNRMILFGGEDKDLTAFNQTWFFNTTSKNWTRKFFVGGLAPHPRVNPAMFRDPGDGNIYLLGGELTSVGAGLSPSTYFWMFNTSSDLWINLSGRTSTLLNLSGYPLFWGAGPSNGYPAGTDHAESMARVVNQVGIQLELLVAANTINLPLVSIASAVVTASSSPTGGSGNTATTPKPKSKVDPKKASTVKIETPTEKPAEKIAEKPKSSLPVTIVEKTPETMVAVVADTVTVSVKNTGKVLVQIAKGNVIGGITVAVAAGNQVTKAAIGGSAGVSTKAYERAIERATVEKETTSKPVVVTVNEETGEEIVEEKTIEEVEEECGELTWNPDPKSIDCSLPENAGKTFPLLGIGTNSACEDVTIKAEKTCKENNRGVWVAFLETLIEIIETFKDALTAEELEVTLSSSSEARAGQEFNVDIGYNIPVPISELSFEVTGENKNPISIFNPKIEGIDTKGNIWSFLPEYDPGDNSYNSPAEQKGKTDDAELTFFPLSDMAPGDTLQVTFLPGGQSIQDTIKAAEIVIVTPLEGGYSLMGDGGSSLLNKIRYPSPALIPSSVRVNGESRELIRVVGSSFKFSDDLSPVIIPAKSPNVEPLIIDLGDPNLHNQDASFDASTGEFRIDALASSNSANQGTSSDDSTTGTGETQVAIS